MRCLLVDDEPGIREGLAMLLRRRGFEVHTAGDCAAAAAQLANASFDVVVTDWRLPDGLAATFLSGCPCPVLAVSGHPEEVEVSAEISAVLAKPITPAKLLDAIGTCVDSHSAEQSGVENRDTSLPRDVQTIIDDALAQLPDDIFTECHDDGTFIVLRARLPEGYVPAVRHLGGDLRIVPAGEQRWLELRLCRDGRPETDMPVVAIDAVWPECRQLALDCQDLQVSAEAFEQHLIRVRERVGNGSLICLLNVPESLETVTSIWETTHDMPMRERVGPRLPAELADLWS